MTPSEASTLRKNASTLYYAVRKSVADIACYCGIRDVARQEEIWKASGLDELFYRLGSQGYKQLISDGWNPFKQENDDIGITPSEDTARATDVKREALNFLKEVAK